MRPEELAQFRSESGLSQKALAELLNKSLDRRYQSGTISQWELGKRPIPQHALNFLESLRDGVQTVAADDGGGASTDGAAPPPPRAEDLPPEVPPGQRPLVPTGDSMEALAAEMFDGIGAMLEVSGVFMASRVIEIDGKIIRTDAKALGTAYGKLADQNAWVKRILLSMTTGGAWVEVIVVTAGTSKKVYDNHVAYAEFIRGQSQPVPAGDISSDGHAEAA